MIDKILKEFDEKIDLDPCLPLNKFAVKCFLKKSLEEQGNTYAKAHIKLYNELKEQEKRLVKQIDESISARYGNFKRLGEEEVVKAILDNVLVKDAAKAILALQGDKE